VAGLTFNGSNNDFAVARLTASGALDTSFDGDGKQTISFGASDDQAYSVTLDSLDRVVLAGTTNNGSNYDFAVARLTGAGALDSTFDGDGKQTIAFGGPDDIVYGVATDSFDRVVVAGYTGNGTSTDFAVARLTPAGSLDMSFDADGKQTFAIGADGNRAFGVAVDSLDRVVAAGQMRNGSGYGFAVARMSVNGALDSSFDADGKQTVIFSSTPAYGYGAAVDSLGRVVVVGYTEYGGPTGVEGPDIAAARLTNAGALDTSFHGNGKLSLGLTAKSWAFGRAVAVDHLGRIVVAGSAETTDNGGGQRFAVARYTPTGTLDPSFGGTGKVTFDFGGDSDVTYAVAIDSLDRVVVAGQNYGHGFNRVAVARLTTAGALDSAFDGDGKQTFVFPPYGVIAYGVAVDSANRVVVAGSTANGSTNANFAVARLTEAGALDSSFDGDGIQIVDFGVNASARLWCGS
jgi:uncharacterized delta-60 repeat protein